jgi:hypothetical protein
MHKDIKVAEVKFDSRGYLSKVTKVFNEEHLPPCVRDPGDEKLLKTDLLRWTMTRSISTSRRDVSELREFYGSDAFLPGNGVSLFDCYWFTHSKMRWEDVNAYDNWDCRKDLLYLMFARPDEIREMDTNSPNLTIPGRRHRLWFSDKDHTYLLFGDAQKEMAAYKLAEGSDIVAEREYKILSGQIYAAVVSETDKEHEMVTLEDLYHSCEREDLSKMENLKACCEKYKIPDWKNFFQKMNEFDERTGNSTRELSDVGVLRDPDTLEVIRFAKL